jgi:predicted lipid-binding transport protein (Tim44 family)
LFGSLGFAGNAATPGGGWGGPGLFDLLLLGLLGYVGYRWFTRRSTQAPGNANAKWSSGQSSPGWSSNEQLSSQEPIPSLPASQSRDLNQGISQLQVLDPSFDPKQFCDQAMDFFFRLQAAW